ncbi:sugar transferase [Aestuariimicrobium sp. p3-SID1156]|uniref:sugar transferase n=1 Tax=Aestuariimicrobium sp. p3-SID1156 TaxID=2916038 RepID=UPI0037BE32A7
MSVARKDNFAKAEKLLMVIADAVIFAGTLMASIWLRFSPLFGWEKGIPGRNLEAVTSTLAYAVVGFIVISVFSGIYVLYNKTPLDVAIITLIDMVLVSLWIGAATFAGSWIAFPRMGLVINFVLGTLVLTLWRWIVYAVYRRVRGNNRVMVLTIPNHESKAVRNFASSRSPRHKLTHVVDGNYLDNVRAHLDEFDSVHVSDKIDVNTRRTIYDYLLDKDKQIFMTADFQRLLTINPNIMSIEDESIMLVSPFKIPAEYDVLKRAVDFLISLVGVVLISPILLITAILVKATSPGPVFYKQIRITKDGREFEILKFRSMAANAEAKSGPMLATSNDARVTKVGKYLRSLRIDELPQLINVLRGDMSLVGPRPERPFFVERFTEINPHYPLRHNVRAGVTGYAQVYGKYASDFESKLNFDLLYIKRYSPILDLKIMLQTVKILFDKVSSQGLEDEQAGGEVVLPADTKILH